MKQRFTVTIDRELLSWLDAKVDSKEFANRSHALELLVRKRIENEGKDNSYT